MWIDEGGKGSTSVGYDHLGYSVLMNTRYEQLCPADSVPTKLSPKMEYSGALTVSLIPSMAKEKVCGMVMGKTVFQNELGGVASKHPRRGVNIIHQIRKDGTVHTAKVFR